MASSVRSAAASSVLRRLLTPCAAAKAIRASVQRDSPQPIYMRCEFTLSSTSKLSRLPPPKGAIEATSLERQKCLIQHVPVRLSIELEPSACFQRSIAHFSPLFALPAWQRPERKPPNQALQPTAARRFDSLLRRERLFHCKLCSLSPAAAELFLVRSHLANGGKKIMTTPALIFFL